MGAKQSTMRLSDYLDGMLRATTASELETAIQVEFKHSFRGPTWAKICKARQEAGYAICAAHPLGSFVPVFGPGRRLTVCGETCRVGRGQNSTGVRYAWHYAEQFIMDVLVRNGLSRRAAHAVYDTWSGYPHRCLKVIEDGLAGRLPDPEMHVLIGPYEGSCPIRCEVSENDASTYDRRAHRPCPCNVGTLFDWGAGWNGYTNFISWRCNRCSNGYTEYVTNERLGDIRRKHIGVPIAA